jgi:hypothetical protein
MSSAPENSRPLDIAIAGVIIVVVIGDVTLAAVLGARHEPPIAVEIGAFGFLLSEVSLLAGWLAFGNYPVPMRLLAVVPGSAIVFFPFFLRDAPFREGGMLAFAACNLVVLGVAILPLLMRILGVRVVRIQTADESTTPLVDGNPLQFTLRQMFSWTLAVAMVAALARFVFSREERPPPAQAIIEVLAFCSTASATVCGGLWAALGRGKPALRIPIVGVACGGVTLMIGLAFHAPFKDMWGTTAIAALEASLTGCALLLWRAAGYRLIGAQRTACGPESRTPLED